MEKGLRYQAVPKEYAIRTNREYRMLPSKRLIARLGLKDFDKPAPMADNELNPEIVKIATCQHVGAPAVPSVTAGEHVTAGQMIGRIPEGSLGAAIHASISGTVIETENGYIVIRR